MSTALANNGALPPTVREAPGGPQRERVAEVQRLRLLLAAVEVVGEQGLERGSVGRICKRAGVSRRTFYELFEDREECVLAAFWQAIERIGERVQPLYRRKGDWRKQTRESLVALLDSLDREPDVARLCVVETLRAGPAVQAARKQVLDVLVDSVEQGRTAGKGAGPAPLTGQGVVGGAISVIHSRLLEHDADPLLELVNPLMATIVQPYLGANASRRELEQPPPSSTSLPAITAKDPFKDLPIRLTYRTALVLANIASTPGASNRRIAASSGVSDDGQMSRLLGRLQSCGLIENTGKGHTRGETNSWQLTKRGSDVQQAISHDPIVS